MTSYTATHWSPIRSRRRGTRPRTSRARDWLSERQRASSSDVALLHAPGCSSPDALAELWDRYGDVTYWVAIGLLGDTALASDVVVSVFVELGRNPVFESDAVLPQQLVAATRQRCLEHVDPSASLSSASHDESDNEGSDRTCRKHLLALTDQQLTVAAMIGSHRYRAIDVARLIDQPLSDVYALLRETLTTLAEGSRVRHLVQGSG